MHSIQRLFPLTFLLVQPSVANQRLFWRGLALKEVDDDNDVTPSPSTPEPTPDPTLAPTVSSQPSHLPSAVPSTGPSSIPSALPSNAPTDVPFCRNTDLTRGGTDQGCPERGQCVLDENNEEHPPPNGVGVQCIREFFVVPNDDEEIFLFDIFDGTLIDDNTDVGFVDFIEVATVEEANLIQVGDLLFLSNIGDRSIFASNRSTAFVDERVFGDFDDDGRTDGLDDVFGIEALNGIIYATNTDTQNDAPGNAIILYDILTEENLGFIPLEFEPFDILFLTDGTFLVSGENKIVQFTENGLDSSVLKTVVNDLDNPQQMTIRPSTGTILVGSDTGLVELDVNIGQVVNIFKEGTDSIRGGVELLNGNLLVNDDTDRVLVVDPSGVQADVTALDLPSESLALIEPLTLVAK